VRTNNYTRFERPRLFLRLAFLSGLSVLLAFSARPAEEPAQVLKNAFAAAKAALQAGDLGEAERHFNQAIALGLRQVANLSTSESRFEEATSALEDALKFVPGDPEIRVDAAMVWFRSGDVNKARQLSQSVVAENPGNARAQNILGRVDLYRGDFGDAIEELKASVAADHDFETSYFLGIAYLKAKRFSDGQQWFHHLQETMGESAALHVLTGRAYSIAHFPEFAVAEFRKALQLDPKYPHAHSLLGYSILEFRGEEAYPEARLEFERELKFRPDDYNALLLLGISGVALRDFAAAETALSHAKRLRPQESFAYLYLGETFSETNRLQLAVDTLEKYIRLVPNPQEASRDVSRAYYIQGQCLRRLGRLEEAQKALSNSQRFRETKFRYDTQHIFDEPASPADGDSRSSDRIAGLLESGVGDNSKTTGEMIQKGVPENPAKLQHAAPQAAESAAAKQYRAFLAEILASSYNDLGVMRAKNSKFAEAADFFKHSAAWNPSLPDLDRNWGLANFKAEQYPDAVPPLERVLAAHPDDSFVRQLLGLSYFFAEKYSQTVEVLSPLSKNPPDDPGLLFAWGSALVRTRQSEAAADIFRRLLLQNTSNPSFHLLLGQAYAQQQDYPNALTELKNALQLDPHLPEAHYYTGIVYLYQSNFEVAAQEFRAELALRPDDPITTYHLGYALLAQGHADDAVPLFRVVIKALPSYEPAFFELGQALLEQGNTAEAIDSLENARKLVPDHDAVYFQLSRAYRRGGRPQEATQALATYQKLIDANRLKKRESMEIDKP
jgi:tetratricopeptide (TPR) repeat protein